MANEQRSEEFQPDRQIAVTDQMVEAGAERVHDLIKSGVGSAYLVEQVYLAMRPGELSMIAPSRFFGSTPRWNIRKIRSSTM